jgi:hypothetical protein
LRWLFGKQPVTCPLRLGIGIRGVLLKSRSSVSATLVPYAPSNPTAAALNWSYNLIAPFYDLVIERPLLKRAGHCPATGEMPGRVLVSGSAEAGLPCCRRCTATSRSVPARQCCPAPARGAHLHIDWVLGDNMAPPFADAGSIMLCCTSSLPSCRMRKSLGEQRVLKPGGTILVFDKFLRRSNMHGCAALNR